MANTKRWIFGGSFYDWSSSTTYLEEPQGMGRVTHKEVAGTTSYKAAAECKARGF